MRYFSLFLSFAEDMNLYKIELLCSDSKGSAYNTEMLIWSLSWEDPLEKGIATHSSTIAWKIPWTGEPGRLQSMGSQCVGDDWVTNIFTFTFPGTVLGIKDWIHGDKDIEWEWGRGRGWGTTIKKKHLQNFRALVLNRWRFFSLFLPRDIWQCLKTFLTVTTLRIGCYWCVSKWRPWMLQNFPQGAGQPPSSSTKNYVILNVSSVAVEKSWIRVMITVTK